MSTPESDDDDVVMGNSVTTTPAKETLPDDVVSASESSTDNDGSVLEISSGAEDVVVDPSENDNIEYSSDTVDFRGENREDLLALLNADAQLIGGDKFDQAARTTGSWENTLFRVLTAPSVHNEEIRIQQALAAMSLEDRKQLASVYKKDGKTLLRTSSILERLAPGLTHSLSGPEAMLAFECRTKGGGYRVPLYNSGISVDIIVPTGNDMQLMLQNCAFKDEQLGTTSGAHYFMYNDVVYKEQIRDFINSLIVNSSFGDWRKNNQLWSIIKLPDLMALVATVAHICYKDGFDGFVVKCLRPLSEEHKQHCKHTETITADISSMILTRFPVLSQEAVDFMVQTRSNTKHTAGQIAKYQADLGLEGEKITFDDLSFVMRVPTVNEHIAAGNQFIADIVNEVESDNTEARYEQFGFRYIRSFLPWIASVEAALPDNTIAQTADPKVIVRQLEKINDIPGSNIQQKLEAYVNKTQLTYVGYPVIPCPTCGYVGDTPSGLWTFDPFNAFFIQALRYVQKALTSQRSD